MKRLLYLSTILLLCLSSATVVRYLWAVPVTYYVSVTNSHASVGTLVNFQDGSGGTVLFTLAAASGFGGHQTQWIVPRKVPTSGNGIFCAPVTTGASIVCSCSGFKSTVNY